MVAENNETPVVQASVVQPAPQPQVMGAPVVAVVVGEKKVMMQGFTTFPQQHQCQWCGHTGMTKVTKEAAWAPTSHAADSVASGATSAAASFPTASTPARAPTMRAPCVVKWWVSAHSSRSEARIANGRRPQTGGGFRGSYASDHWLADRP
eukprot:CAMPEP_0170284602 /NCGR_PEP_ID=MMETSP0116_2-20130129/42340_1 /TAXON_ID=400756 /ORGANISM="Durinskia baltica, Strain CSIRO CS-38" /LENGTH=150 /DNA_ID=CAMNT_0010535983 /DNA_START=103 /DNA_END=552 /DNA_ORIENTATION=+